MDDDHERITRPPFRDGNVHVLAGRCATCIFRPGNLMHLQPGRVKEMVEQSLGADTAVICHDTIYSPGVDEAICRGFYDRYGDRTAPLRLARLLGYLVEDPIPPKEICG